MEKRYTESFVDKQSGNIKGLTDEEFSGLLDVVLYEKARRDMENLRGSSVELKYELYFMGKPNGGVDWCLRPTLVRLKPMGTKEHFNMGDELPY